MVTSPSCFYKFIGDKGFDRLIKEEIIKEMKFERTELCNGKAKYKLKCSGMNDQAYGKFIEEHICNFLMGKLTTLIEYIPSFDIDKFINMCKGSISRVSTGASTGGRGSVKYDLLYNNYLIDIKTYKHKFTNTQLKSFYLQLLIYYSLLKKQGIKSIKYIAILNPISGVFLRIDVKGIDVDNLLIIFNGCNDIVDTLIDKSIVKLKKRGIIRRFFRAIRRRFFGR
jgi:hypothetical protein